MKIEELDLPGVGIDYHKELNPRVWDNYSLKPRIRKVLLETARAFIETIAVPGLKIDDIVLTGSMANYNYTKFSDYDLHIIADYSESNKELLDSLFRAKKMLWNNNHDITINGQDVEVYVANTSSTPAKAGTFSLLRDDWVNKPRFAPPEYNDAAIDEKSSAIMQDIDRATNTDTPDSEELDRISTKIWKLREAGLRSAGEFSIENLSFKVLRNLGYIAILNKAKLDLENRRLSI